MNSKHTEALNELEAMHDARLITESEYAVHRANLMADATKPAKTWTAWILILGVLLLILLGAWS